MNRWYAYQWWRAESRLVVYNFFLGITILVIQFLKYNGINQIFLLYLSEVKKIYKVYTRINTCFTYSVLQSPFLGS
jgi:hypothetical protein